MPPVREMQETARAIRARYRNNQIEPQEGSIGAPEWLPILEFTRLPFR